MIREPYLAYYGGLDKKKIFKDFFIQEVALREKRGRIKAVGASVEEKFEKMLSKMAEKVWNASIELNINACNLCFIFLNRYYAFFVKTNPLPKMPFFWEEFLINIRSEVELLSLMNYDDARRELVCQVIREMKEGKQSEGFKRFVTEYINGYRICYPKHDKERSQWFEYVLLMLKQIEDKGMNYYFEQHGIEIVKAHILDLKKFGDPVQLHLGNFIGDAAMWRLKSYLDWQRQHGQKSIMKKAEF